MSTNKSTVICFAIALVVTQAARAEGEIDHVAAIAPAAADTSEASQVGAASESSDSSDGIDPAAPAESAQPAVQPDRTLNRLAVSGATVLATPIVFVATAGVVYSVGLMASAAAFAFYLGGGSLGSLDAVVGQGLVGTMYALVIAPIAATVLVPPLASALGAGYSDAPNGQTSHAAMVLAAGTGVAAALGVAGLAYAGTAQGALPQDVYWYAGESVVAGAVGAAAAGLTYAGAHKLLEAQQE